MSVQLNQKCPRCGAFELVAFTDENYEDTTICPVCGATTSDITGEEYLPPSFYQTRDDLAHALDDVVMPSDATKAEKWLKDYEDKGITFPHAVIIDDDGKLTWLRGSPAYYCWGDTPQILTELETGKYYWFRHVQDVRWRAGYVIDAPDGIQWILPLEIDPIRVNTEQMILSDYEFIEIRKPNS